MAGDRPPDATAEWSGCVMPMSMFAGRRLPAHLILDRPSEHKRWALNYNPLALLAGRDQSIIGPAADRPAAPRESRTRAPQSAPSPQAARDVD